MENARARERAILMSELDGLLEKFLTDFQAVIEGYRPKDGKGEEGTPESRVSMAEITATMVARLENIAESFSERFAEAVYSLNTGDPNPMILMFKDAERVQKRNRDAFKESRTRNDQDDPEDEADEEEGEDALFSMVDDKLLIQWRKILEGLDLIDVDLLN
jgi:hypothetical protein